MVERIVKALDKMIIDAKKNGKCSVDLEMKKKVIDTQNNGLNDMLQIWFPTSTDLALGFEKNYRVAEYSEDSARKFNSLTEVAEFIVNTYC